METRPEKCCVGQIWKEVHAKKLWEITDFNPDKDLWDRTELTLLSTASNVFNWKPGHTIRWKDPTQDTQKIHWICIFNPET